MNGMVTAQPTPATSSPTLPPTLLSTIHPFTVHNVLLQPPKPASIHHSFPASTDSNSEAGDPVTTLHALIQATEQLSHSLNLHSSVAFSNPKFISILRQQTAIAHNLHLSDQNIRQTVSALRTRSIAYGEDIPLDRATLVDWAISRLQVWATSVGMETFKDNPEPNEGRVTTVVLGGKVLVLDIDLLVRRQGDRAEESFETSSNTDQDRETDGEEVVDVYPRVEVKSLKTSYAVPNGALDGSTTNTEGSSSLDVLLASSIRAFLTEVQKDTDSRDALEAERLGKNVVSHLRYLMMLDRLATRKEGEGEGEGGGIRWFVGVDELGVGVEKFARREADGIASSLALPHAPLDIFLHRSHALPLPYLLSPSLSFLTYLSPLAYLSILRSTPSSPPSPGSDNLPKLDIPFIRLRECLSNRHRQQRLSGVTMATLSLSPSPQTEVQTNTQLDSLPSMEVDGDSPGRPTFTLAKPEIEYTFPQLPNPPKNLQESSSSNTLHYTWILDFTSSSGRHRGVVMSQSRMQEIECLLDPSRAGAGVSVMDDSLAMMDFASGSGLGGPSWVDLLLNPDSSSTSSSEKYTAVYRSPSSAHPPLQLRLTTPDEPGFVLENVKVKNMKEVWGILEIVKEQCWLNETLNTCEWAPESPMHLTSTAEGEPATEDLLQALLNGTYMPNSIPIEIYLPPPTNAAFSSADLSFSVPHGIARQPPKISMTLPERLPISGLVEIVVSYDLTRPKGVRVDVGGGLGMGIGVEGSGVDVEALEEVCRRGGLFCLGGRVWKGSGGQTA